jgi:hypothetical protein
MFFLWNRATFAKYKRKLCKTTQISWMTCLLRMRPLLSGFVLLIMLMLVTICPSRGIGLMAMCYVKHGHVSRLLTVITTNMNLSPVYWLLSVLTRSCLPSIDCHHYKNGPVSRLLTVIPTSMVQSPVFWLFSVLAWSCLPSTNCRQFKHGSVFHLFGPEVYLKPRKLRPRPEPGKTRRLGLGSTSCFLAGLQVPE